MSWEEKQQIQVLGTGFEISKGSLCMVRMWTELSKELLPKD